MVLAPIFQKLIKLMSGRLSVRSKPGEGSLFEFTLPAILSDMSGSSKPCCAQPVIEDKTLKGLHVALLDSDLVRQVLSFSHHNSNYLQCVIKERSSRSLNFSQSHCHFFLAVTVLTLDVTDSCKQSCCRKSQLATCGA